MMRGGGIFWTVLRAAILLTAIFVLATAFVDDQFLSNAASSSGAALGGLVLLLLAVCVGLLIQCIGDILSHPEAWQSGVSVSDDEPAQQRWPPSEEPWWQLSEPVKDALLDLTMGPAKAEKPWPETLPPLAPGELAQRLRTRVDQTLTRVVEIMNQSPRGEVPPAERPRLRQLFKDLEHDILELGRQLRIESAYHSLPPAEGHWAERYRHMKKETALGRAIPPDESPPTNN